MAKKAVSRRYAQAVFEIALANNELDKWLSDLREIARLSEAPALLAWLESPRVHFQDKWKLLKEQLKVGPLTLNLTGLLIARGKFANIGEIAGEYQRLLDSYRGIEQAEVVTAVPLDQGDTQRLSQRLSAVLGKNISIKAEVDASIIGGIVVRVGGKLLDGSTRGKLLALKQKIAGGGE